MTGYVYRGSKPEGLGDLETVNAAIMAARDEAGHGLRNDVTCAQGPPWDSRNTIIRGDGTKRCRACRLEYNRRKGAAA